MSDIEWSHWIQGDGSEAESLGAEEIEINIDEPSVGIDDATHYRIPMSDYKRITGMPEWDSHHFGGIAQDRDGQWVGACSCNLMFPCRAHWGTNKGVTKIGSPGTVLGDWRETLQERPRDQLATHPNSDPDADQCSVGADNFPQDARDELLNRAQERNLNPYDAPGFLEAALGHMEDRKTTYDAPEGERSMGKTVAAFNAITGRDLSEEEGWLFMVLLKAVRTQQGAFRADNYEDGAAYFALQGEAAVWDRGHE